MGLMRSLLPPSLFALSLSPPSLHPPSIPPSLHPSTHTHTHIHTHTHTHRHAHGGVGCACWGGGGGGKRNAPGDTPGIQDPDNCIYNTLISKSFDCDQCGEHTVLVIASVLHGLTDAFHSQVHPFHNPHIHHAPVEPDLWRNMASSVMFWDHEVGPIATPLPWTRLASRVRPCLIQAC
jgi:hypothetical protein